jgi:hypothetical protein
LYADWVDLTSDSIANLARIADEFDAPIAVRNGAVNNDYESKILRANGFEGYMGAQERMDRPSAVMFSHIRPAGGITATTPLFSQGAKSPRTPISTITQAITKAYGNLLPRLEGKGLVSLTQTEEEAIAAAAQARADQNGGDVEAIKESLRRSVLASEASDIDVKRSADGNLEGFFDPATGKSFLIADNLTAESAPGTLMHEVGIHMAAEGKFGPMFDRALTVLNDGSLESTEALRRMQESGETSGEEAAAYLVTVYETNRTNAPASVKQWIKDFIADVRAWLFSKGVLLKADQLTIADIAAVARANARSMAQGVNGQPDGEAPAASRARPVFSRAAQGQASGVVQSIVDAITARWANAPKVVVAFDMSDPAIPERVRQEDQRQRSGGAEGTPEGFYYKGTVYLMSSKLANPRDVVRVLFHEALGHYGLRGVFGKELKPLLQQIATMRKSQIEAKMKEYGLRGVSNVDRLIAAEEVLAELAQSNPQIGFVRRAVATVKAWLRKHVPGFMGMNMSDDEIITSFIMPARNYVVNGGPDGGTGGGVRFNRSVGDASPDEAQKVQAAIEGKSLIDAAKFVVDTGEARHRVVAEMVTEKLKALQSAGVSLDLKIAHRGFPVPTALFNSRGYTESAFDDKGRDITVWLNGADVTGKVGTDYETLLHELVHAATMGGVLHGSTVRGSPFAKDAADLMEVTDAIASHINKRFDDADAGRVSLTEFELDMRAGANNAFTKDDETLAWALSSVEAQQYLETIPYKKSGQTMWGRFVQAVRSAIGLEAKADTALSEVLRLGASIMSTDGDANVRGVRAFWHKRGLKMATQQANGSVVLRNEVGPAYPDSPTHQKKMDQAETPEFKRWFGDSKVVDAEGKPLVVYHGTAADFAEFSDASHRSILNSQYQGDGFHFSANPGVASAYADAARNQFINKDRIFALVDDKMPPLAAKVFKAVVNDGYDAAWDLPDAEVSAILAESRDAGIDLNELLDIAEAVEGTNYHKGRKQSFDAGMIFGSSGPSGVTEWMRTDAVKLGLHDALPNQSVLPVYLSAKNILRTRNPKAAKAAKANGYDGVYYYGEGTVRGEPEYIVFEPTQIKSATGNNGDFDPEDPDIRFSFAGQQAATADTMALATAQQRLEAGEDAETVRQETGWFQGKDGKWRFEINDSDAKLKIGKSRYIKIEPKKNEAGVWAEIKLGELLDHQALFSAYPDLRNMVVSLKSYGGNGGFFNGSDIVLNGSISPRNIVVADDGPFSVTQAEADAINEEQSKLGDWKIPDPSSTLSVLLHEIQHGIQNIEGFATGGTPKNMAKMLDKEKFDAMVAKDDALTAEFEALKKKYSGIADNDLPKGVSEKVRQLRSEINAVRNTGWREATNPFSRGQYTDDELFAGYRRLAGEVEARNTQARQGMTDAQRRETAPSATADTPDSDVIVVFNGKVAMSAPTPANAAPDAAPQPPRTPAATIRAAINRAYGNLLDKLEAKGLVTIAQTEREAIEAAAQARADKTGGDVEQIKRSMLASVQMQRVWHGSPHRGIQQFSTEFMGKGEGEQAFGWGLYFASKMEIAESYRKELSGVMDRNNPDDVAAEEAVMPEFLALQDRYAIADEKGNEAEKAEIISSIEKIVDDLREQTLKRRPGQLYEVEIPKDSDMLLWDKPLSEQPASVRKILSKEWGSNQTGESFYKEKALSFGKGGYWKDAGYKPASEYLSSLGIKGIKYPARTRSGEVDGSYNYVIFDGADTQIVDVKYSANGNIEGFFDKQTGKSFLVADNLTAASAPGTLMHEVGIHMAAGGKLEPLFTRAANLLKMARGNAFIQRVQSRMDEAGETSNEEAAAYIVTEYENDRTNAPASVGKWVKDFIADVRAWLFNKGVLLKADQLTVADIAAVARANANRMAKGDAKGDVRYSKAAPTDQTQTAAFKRWFGDSKVVDADGKPLVVYHGTAADFNAFDLSKFGLTDAGWFGKGFYFTEDKAIADRYGKTKSVFLSLEKPMSSDEAAFGADTVKQIIAETKRLDPKFSPKDWLEDDLAGEKSALDQLENMYRAGAETSKVLQAVTDVTGFDGVVSKGIYIAFNPTQIKSALGNNGNFDGNNPDIRFSRSIGGALADGVNNVRDMKLPAGYMVNDLIQSHGKLGWWSKTVGTQFHLAQKSPAFKRVFDSAQGFLNDVSYYASEAANAAPTLLPKLETLKDLGKQAISAADNKAIAAPIFEGTLVWGRSDDGRAVKLVDENDDTLTPGVAFTPDELRLHFGLTGELGEDGKWTGQIGLYQEFRAATDKSLTNMGLADMVRFGGKDLEAVADEVLSAENFGQALAIAGTQLRAVAQGEPKRAAVLLDTIAKMVEKVNKYQGLMDKGYAPLSRFGRHTLDVVDENGDRVYFGLFESESEANKMARQMRANYPGAQVAQGTVSEEEHKLFAGVSPETVELFGEMLGLEGTGDEAADMAFQQYLKMAKANRSAMKRLIHRKGIAGFSEDPGRVLAGFVYSNARQTSSAVNMGELTQAVAAIPKGQGELKDHAVRLHNYVKNPIEEAQAFRGLLFAQYIGGSVASAIINTTQPFAVTMPWLSQFGGVSKAAKQMSAAVKDALKGSTGDAVLDKALLKAAEDGIVSPQEVFTDKSSNHMRPSIAPWKRPRSA